MRVQLESTTKIVELLTDGGQVVLARVWEGTTDGGIACHAFITRIACKNGADATEFERDLKEQRAPSVEVAGIPLRMIL